MKGAGGWLGAVVVVVWVFVCVVGGPYLYWRALVRRRSSSWGCGGSFPIGAAGGCQV
jgi:hypothetical protein